MLSRQHPFDSDPFGMPPDVDLDWGDFFFNLVSMCIVYVYFSKAAVAGESMVAILLCMGVAAFDIVLLVMRWLWYEQYFHYGSVVLHIFQVRPAFFSRTQAYSLHSQHLIALMVNHKRVENKIKIIVLLRELLIITF